MIKVVIFGLTLMVIIALIWLMPALIKVRRQAIKNRPFPVHWEVIIEQNLIFYKHFPQALRTRLQGHINFILAEKQFIGCGGLAITEEIKLTIAAISALLLLNGKGIEHKFHRTIDGGHGGIEKRRCWVLGQVEYLIDAEQWSQFQSIAMVESVRQCEGKFGLSQLFATESPNVGLTIVPFFPDKISAASSNLPIPAILLVASTKRQAASIFGCIEPEAKI